MFRGMLRRIAAAAVFQKRSLAGTLAEEEGFEPPNEFPR